jgi:hypothetical protein
MYASSRPWLAETLQMEAPRAIAAPYRIPAPPIRRAYEMQPDPR